MAEKKKNNNKNSKKETEKKKVSKNFNNRYKLSNKEKSAFSEMNQIEVYPFVTNND